MEEKNTQQKIGEEVVTVVEKEIDELDGVVPITEAIGEQETVGKEVSEDRYKELGEGAEVAQNGVEINELEAVIEPELAKESDTINESEPTKETEIVKEVVSEEEPEVNQEPEVVRARKLPTFLANKWVVIGAIGIGVVVGCYAVIALLFANRFFYGTTLNGIDVGGLRAAQVQDILNQKGTEGQLIVIGREGVQEVVLGGIVDLVYYTDRELDALIKEQNSLKWPKYIGKATRIEVGEIGHVDEEKLQQVLANMACMQVENQQQPADAHIVLVDNRYHVKEAYEGTLLDGEKTYQVVKQYLAEGKDILDLDKEGCYIVADVMKDTMKLQELVDIANSYIASEITYLFGELIEVVDASVIMDWIEIGEESVVLNQEKVDAYIDALAEKYNTYGKTRAFTTTSGKVVTVNGGDYGRYFSPRKEKEYLYQAILAGTIEERNPLTILNMYDPSLDDIGDTYAEINLTKQYIWFYYEGELIVESDIVTGDIARNWYTPEGTYKLTYKARNATLRGPGYATPVAYWMPFNGGIGMHDATWRSRFGGEIYQYDGSHGCINMPLEVAGTIFEYIEKHMPVVCYFEED